MARILYGVAGEGRGHAVRSRVAIEPLRKKNTVKIVASDKAYDYLTQYFDVEKIGYFKIIYRNNKAAYISTFLYNIIQSPRILMNGWKVSRIISAFKPDVIITDFEPLVAYCAFFRRIPLISIGNPLIITRAHHKDIPKKYWFSSWVVRLVIRCYVIHSTKYFIDSFFNCKTKDKKSILIKPLLRKRILYAKTTSKDHIIVYQTSKSNKKLIKVLQKINEKFIVYGFNSYKKLGNVTLKDISEKEFLEDLKSCKAVITNGGFMLISEALYLKKPVLSIPVERQFEQVLNAIYLQRLGYGMFAEKTTKETIETFIKDISKFRKKLKNYKKYNNNEAIRKINNAIKSLS